MRIPKIVQTLSSKNIVMACAGFYHSVVLIEEETEGMQSSYIQDFQKLLGNSLRSDLSFVFEDNIAKAIYAHRAIIYVRCPLLDKEIDNKCEKAGAQFLDVHKNVSAENHAVFRVAGFSIQSFLRCLEYIYTDQALFLKDNQKEEFSNSVLMETIKLSDMYDLPQLRSIYIDEIRNRLCLQSACELYNLSHKYSIPDIKEIACKFILENSAEIIKMEGFLDLPKDLMTIIMQSISLKLTSLEETLKKV